MDFNEVLYVEDLNNDLAITIDDVDLDNPTPAPALPGFGIENDLETNSPCLCGTGNGSTTIVFQRVDSTTYTSYGDAEAFLGGRPPHPPHPGKPLQ